MKKVYLQPQVEIVSSSPFALCAGTMTADYENKSEGGGNGDIPIDTEDGARITWGNLWEEEEQNFYAYNAWE